MHHQSLGLSLVSLLSLFSTLIDSASAVQSHTIPHHPFSDASLAQDTSSHNPIVRRIAVIGAGSAGSSTAYHLQKFATQSGLNVSITVFEKSSFVGGRSTTVNAYGNPLEPVELGASIFVEINYILKNAMDAFGLKPKDSTKAEDEETLGVWNGEKFVFIAKANGWYYWDIAKMFWKYGFSPVRTQRLMKATVGRFLKLYEAPFFPFRSLTERAIDLDLINVTAVTGRQYLEANNIAEPFSTNVIQASTRVNYAQNLGRIHGLETMVCMAIEGAMQIEGGNWKIFDGMLNASNATVLLNTSVTSISKQDGKYSIKSSTKDSMSATTQTANELFDSIVLAAPLQYTNISLEKGFFKYTPDKIPYVKLHVTLFASPLKLNPLYFNLLATEEAPSTILTTLPQDAPLNQTDKAGAPGFFSISTLRSAINPVTGNNEFLYKIFSAKEVTPTFLSDILGAPVPGDLTTIKADGQAITWYYPHIWNSYPVESPRVTFEELELARGFYYTSGVESFISTMETSALMGMNIAQLIVNDYLELLMGNKGATEQVVFAEKEMGSEEL